MTKRIKSVGGKAKSVSRTKSQTQASGLDLGSLFSVAAQVLASNQSALNQADAQNQNHGDNMVQAFNMITQVLSKQKGSTPSEQLSQASQYLAQHSTSGSAHVYSQGLAQAAQQFKGQSMITPENAMTLVQSLLGGGQSASQGGGEILRDLLGEQQGQAGGGQEGSGIDLGDLVNAGMTFMNAKQQGQNNLQAALSALMSDGPMGQSAHRQQSGQMVANALLQAISGMSK